MLADIRHTTAPEVSDFDSSEPGSTLPGMEIGIGRVIALGMLGALMLIGLMAVARRQVTPH